MINKIGPNALSAYQQTKTQGLGGKDADARSQPEQGKPATFGDAVDLRLSAQAKAYLEATQAHERQFPRSLSSDQRQKLSDLGQQLQETLAGIDTDSLRPRDRKKAEELKTKIDDIFSGRGSSDSKGISHAQREQIDKLDEQIGELLDSAGGPANAETNAQLNKLFTQIRDIYAEADPAKARSLDRIDQQIGRIGTALSGLEGSADEASAIDLGNEKVNRLAGRLDTLANQSTKHLNFEAVNSLKALNSELSELLGPENLESEIAGRILDEIENLYQG